MIVFVNMQLMLGTAGRLGEFGRAIADDWAALAITPGNAWSRDGRRLARLHKNDPSGKADLDAAVPIDPAIPSRCDRAPHQLITRR